MAWTDDLLDVALFALESLMSENRRMSAQKPSQLHTLDSFTSEVHEREVVREIYTIMTEFSYGREKIRDQAYIGREEPLRGTRGRNPPRADLAIKPFGVGQKMNFIEVKPFSNWNNRRQELLKADTKKLKEKAGRTNGKFCLVYRAFPLGGRDQSLRSSTLIRTALASRKLSLEGERFSEEFILDGGPGKIHIQLLKVARAL